MVCYMCHTKPVACVISMLCRQRLWCHNRDNLTGNADEREKWSNALAGGCAGAIIVLTCNFLFVLTYGYESGTVAVSGKGEVSAALACTHKMPIRDATVWDGRHHKILLSLYRVLLAFDRRLSGACTNCQAGLLHPSAGDAPIGTTAA